MCSCLSYLNQGNHLHMQNAKTDGLFIDKPERICGFGLFAAMPFKFHNYTK